MVVEELEKAVSRAEEGNSVADRKSLLSKIADLMAHPEVPETAKRAAMDVVGKLARRACCEPACQQGLEDMIKRTASRRDG